MNRQLPAHEWMAVFFFIAVLFVLGSLSLLHRDPHLPQPPIQIQVCVTGEVESPGFYAMPPGSTVRDLCRHVLPKQDTEPYKLSYDTILKDGQKVRFKSSLVSVHIKGAVEKPQTLKLKLGSKLSEVQDLIGLTPNSDFSKVKNRMIKRNHQTITVPVKKESA